MEPTDVSIIIPTYNAGKSLISAIESILCTTSLRIQIVIMEDGSLSPSELLLKNNFPNLLDNTEALCSIVYRQQDNQGAYHARLNALPFCTGSLVKFLDQDDQLLPGALAQEVATFDQKTDVVLTNWLITHEFEGRVEYCKAPIYTDPISDFLRVGGCFTSAALYRTSLVEKVLKPVTGFKPIKADDWLIFAQVCLSGARYKTLNLDSYTWNQSESQLSRNSANLLVTEHYSILDYYEQQLESSDRLTLERKNLLANYYAKQLLFSYEKDPIVFELILVKISSLNPKYNMKHGHQIYKKICRLFGVRNGTKIYSYLKRAIKKIS